MNIVIVNDFYGEHEAHRAGCRGIAEAGDSFPWPITVDTKLEAAEALFDGQIEEESMTAEQGLGEINFKPCTRDLPVRIAGYGIQHPDGEYVAGTWETREGAQAEADNQFAAYPDSGRWSVVGVTQAWIEANS